MLALHVFFANQVAIDVDIHAAFVHSPRSEVPNGQLDLVVRCFDLVWQCEVDVEHGTFKHHSVVVVLPVEITTCRVAVAVKDVLNYHILFADDPLLEGVIYLVNTNQFEFVV